MKKRILVAKKVSTGEYVEGLVVEVARCRI